MGFLQGDGGASLLRQVRAAVLALGSAAIGAGALGAQIPIGTFGPGGDREPPPTASGISNGGLYYEISGRGQDWVVLIHGFGVDERMWKAQMPALNANFHVLRYDLPSHGRSPAPAAPRQGWQDLAQLLDQLNIPRANIVGLSAGSVVAVDFAVVSPERVERLVLASPNIDGYKPKENMMEWFAPIVAQARAGHADSAAALFAASKLLKLYGDTAAQPRLTALVMANASVWRDTLRPRTPPLTPPALAQLGVIHAPVLVIVGAHDGADTRAIADTIVKSVKRGKELVFPNAGHVVNFDQPSKFDSAVVAFLTVNGMP